MREHSGPVVRSRAVRPNYLFCPWVRTKDDVRDHGWTPAPFGVMNGGAVSRFYVLRLDHLNAWRSREVEQPSFDRHVLLDVAK